MAEPGDVRAFLLWRGEEGLLRVTPRELLLMERLAASPIADHRAAVAALLAGSQQEAERLGQAWDRHHGQRTQRGVVVVRRLASSWWVPRLGWPLAVIALVIWVMALPRTWMPDVATRTESVGPAIITPRPDPQATWKTTEVRPAHEVPAESASTGLHLQAQPVQSVGLGAALLAVLGALLLAMRASAALRRRGGLCGLRLRLGVRRPVDGADQAPRPSAPRAHSAAPMPTAWRSARTTWEGTWVLRL